jgi:hypothetical protein
VGGAAAVLGRRRAAAIALLAAAVAGYTAAAGSLWHATVWWDVAFFGLVLIPATLALVWLVLPLQGARGLLLLGLALAVLAGALYLADLDVAFNFAKLAALVALGFWFLGWFEDVSWVVLVAFIIPWVDVVSVWRGPTQYVVNEQPGIFDRISVAFREPGSDRSANLGPPDILFYALFLAAARRFELRTGWTWLCMTGGLGATIALAVWGDVSGLPALPAVCLGFLAPNADLLWRRLRRASTVA